MKRRRLFLFAALALGLLALAVGFGGHRPSAMVVTQHRGVLVWRFTNTTSADMVFDSWDSCLHTSFQWTMTNGLVSFSGRSCSAPVLKHGDFETILPPGGILVGRCKIPPGALQAGIYLQYQDYSLSERLADRLHLGGKFAFWDARVREARKTYHPLEAHWELTP